ncbi:glutamyl-tRNA amidotransferase [Pseudoroseomonas deserti]|uniref:Glutamyl-tRNA amidotransferase n=1 Tax=Teichococcus deserti TaxID=1817963 RepID=A0A1V2H296_9PROT|nr:amidase [Pseudoroseomonas deserti]ONG53173.1 glutamyl-tRNA amidotransferase [Pseudoroseomonas deserti]
MRDEAFIPGPRLTLPGAGAGPLAGLSFAAKDLFDVAGHPTGAGNPDWPTGRPLPQRHAWAVQRLLDAGAALAGKTVTCEVSLGILGFNQFDGTPRNPAAPGCLPGGSSSGSASAVAAGTVDTALGTDSGGSVRVPSSLCGLYGIRPTHGRIPADGMVAQAPSFDTTGWFARDAATFARVAAVMLGEAIPEAVAPAPLLLAADAFALADEPVQQALLPVVERVAGLLGKGTERMTLGEPGELAVWGAQRNVIQRSEAWASFRPWIDAANPRFAFNVARNLAFAASLTEAQIALARSVRERARARARLLLEGGAILAIPTTPFTAPPLGLPLPELDRCSERIGLLCSFAGLTGVPQLSLPLAQAGGKPIGLSLIAARGQDARLVAIARAL